MYSKRLKFADYTYVSVREQELVIGKLPTDIFSVLSMCDGSFSVKGWPTGWA